MTLFVPATTLQFPTNDQMKSFTRAIWNHDYGASAQQFCRFLAILIAATYVAGMALGSFVHQCNEQLRRFTAQFHEPSWHEQRLLEVRTRIANAVEPQAAAKPATARPASRPARKRSTAAATKPAETPVSTSVTKRKRTAPGAPCTTPDKGFAGA